MLSIIIPTYNEKANISALVKRLVRPLNLKKIDFELVFVDDHSTDGTFEYLKELQSILPIHVLKKTGKRGKARSLLQGFKAAKGDILAFIDADLEYPPEAIPGMVNALKNADIIVGKRKYPNTELRFRKLKTDIFKFVFGRIILGLNTDVQSGLKVFKREVLHNLVLHPTKWGFDYEFLFKAKRMGWKIGEMPVEFVNRTQGESSVSLLTVLELSFGALMLRLKYIFYSVFKFLEYPHKSERHPIGYANRNDFLFLPDIHSAKKHWYAETYSLLGSIALAILAVLFGLQMLLNISVLVIISGMIALFYLILITFKLRMIQKSFNQTFVDVSDRDIENFDERNLPMYTILIPLYKEAEVIPQIKTAMTAIDYPVSKLEIIITLEAYDKETMDAIVAARLPDHFKTLILPDVKPKTKPKALNVALPHVRGDYLVIFDAEIVPDTNQLKKAFMAFQKHPNVSALQTRLDHYNPDQTIITRLFNEEFSFHFDMMLPGLQKMGYPLPLSGHSVHFKTAVLKEIGGWDPYNVTEDADMGIRLARAGHKIEILDSFSREEATTSMVSWVKQRTRWIKGFIQTTIVHMRHPLRFKRELNLGWGGFLAFVITVPASVVVNILNLFFWALFIGWLTTHSIYIKALFPGPIYYASLFSFLAGNFLFVYLNMVSSYNRQRFSIVKYGLLSPFYWFLLAIASVKAVIEFFVNPYYWDKTKHGVHLKKKTDAEVVKQYAIPTNN